MQLQMKMNSRITTFDSLRYLLDLDETDHDLKEMATLFVDALRDWGNCQNIVKCVEDFKAYFGNPLTVENTAHYTGRSNEDWAWRGEAGMSLSKMIAISTKAHNIADFDTIVDNFLGHYEQKFLLTSKQEPISSTGYARFKLCSSILREADFMHWLGLEPDEFGGTDNTDQFEGTKTTIWSIRTPMTQNSVSANQVRSIVNRLIPIKDRLMAIKQADPDLICELDVVLWSDPLDLYITMDNETLLFLGEIGAEFSSEMFVI
jgi:Domain of unknown function (DUF4279)